MSTALLRAGLMVGVVLAYGCAAPAATEPVAPRSQDVMAPSPYRDAAFIVDVSTVRKSVKIAAPFNALAANTSTGPSLALLSSNGMHRAQLSLLGGDALEMIASNYSAGVVGAAVPGKVLITFDLTLINKLRGIRLITPTFPLPPSNVTGIQAFPLEVVTLTTAGGATTTGGVITVTSPRAGTAVPSADWDGAPHSFFNDTSCGGVSSDCFRYEPFGTLEALASSPARRVGFLVDPTVGDLRVRVIVAADLQSVTR